MGVTRLVSINQTRADPGEPPPPDESEHASGVLVLSIVRVTVRPEVAVATGVSSEYPQ